MHLAHVITGLDAGGAERLLVSLLEPWSRRGVDVEVVSLRDDGALAGAVEARGVELRRLAWNDGRRGLSRTAALLRRWRQRPPDLIHGWLYHGCVAASALGASCGVPVVWGVHQTSLAAEDTRLSTRIVAALSGPLSHFSPAAILCCGESVRRAHQQRGYPASLLSVIDNGIDLRRFARDPQAPLALRRSLGLAATTHLIGMAARAHPQKDHATFADAAAALAARQSNVHFVLLGAGTDSPQLGGLFATPTLAGRVHRLGLRRDVTAILAGCDLVTLTSRSEATPLSLLEAMACGVPCVTTHTGDCADIVGPSGRVVPVGDAAALAAAWAELLADSALRESLGRAARQRIEARYDLERCADDYLTIYGRFARPQTDEVRRG